jgi:guanylate kinase
MGTAVKLERDGLLLCLVGPAGCGKTTFANLLLSHFSDSLKGAVAATSRAPRGGEIDGVSYHFLTRETFQKLISEGAFFEWEETHGNLYGTLTHTLEEAQRSGTDLLLTVDIRGALTFKRHFPNHTVIVFLVPPSREVLEERLRKRGAAPEAEVQTRLSTAAREFAHLEQFASSIDYFVVNQEIDATLGLLSSILVAERARLHRVKRDVLHRICSLSVAG